MSLIKRYPPKIVTKILIYIAMRCQNCGWSNPDGASLCEKCKQPLDVIQSNNATSREHEQYQPVQP